MLADYGCFPLWEASPGVIGNVNPEDLPLTAATKQALLDWAECYDSTLNDADPASSGFPSADAEAEFWQVARALLAKLRLELGQDFVVELRAEDK